MPDPDPDETPDEQTSAAESLLTMLWQISKETIITLVIVGFIAGLLFAYTGLWPPFVSVVSGSMEPTLERGDLVLITDADHIETPAEYTQNGIVTHNRGENANIQSFGDYGQVIVFTPNGGSSNYNIIHRAMFHVEQGEDWTDRLNPKYASTTNCSRLQYCPAPHDGFITKGDANSEYDQTSEISGPVPAEDITGVARFKIPYVGRLHLMLDG